VEIVDPFSQVDNVLMPYTDIEMRKIERLGKVQHKRYLKNREIKRQELILNEETHQERRLQDCYSRLFRVHLILAAQEMSPTSETQVFNESASGVFQKNNKSKGSASLFSTNTSGDRSSSSSSSCSRAGEGGSGSGGDKQIIEENLLKSHISLRAAFRAFHPERMEAYENILIYTHDVLIKLLVRV
jgi:hypothetical protein